ncbi:MAG: hypothetical protein ACRD2L_00080, partial [Terriglobia bacterium]
IQEEAPPIAIDFVSNREGVFEDVLQETALSVFKEGGYDNAVSVCEIVPSADSRVVVRTVGKFKVDREGPWVLPRSPEQAKFMRHLRSMQTRLSDLGYSVSTGPLVWNRHKERLRERRAKHCYPIIWAEAVSESGFEYSATKKNHAPYIELESCKSPLVVNRECVLVQRTTSKEQDRRLLAAVMPQSFVDSFGVVAVENHLNMIYSVKRALIDPLTIAVLLNTRAIDLAFRCISGSVAVSAYELNALHLPSFVQLQRLHQAIADGASAETIEVLVAGFYGW